MITTSRKNNIVGTIVPLVLLGTEFTVKKFFFGKVKTSFNTAKVVKMDLEENVLASGSFNVSAAK